MKTFFKIFLIIVLALGLGMAIYYVLKTNAKEVETFDTEKPTRISLSKNVVATGKIIPREEIEIKPNISGIIDQVYVKEGDKVSNGDLIAKIRVVPNISQLNSLKQSISQAKVNLENETRNYNRQKNLYQQGVVSKAQYENALATYNLAQQNLRATKTEYQVAQTGIAPGLEKYATIQVRATSSGMVLDIPVELGDNVQEINNFSTGTTIATIADITDMIFEGKVDEAEAGKLTSGMNLTITIGALPNQEFKAQLFFIAPKGIEEAGTVKFEIKAQMQLTPDQFIRSGFSANAQIELEKRENVLAINESLVQYDDGQAFVEVKLKDGEFKKKEVELGVSDGLNVEVIKGIKASDQIKVWNPIKEEKQENES